MIFFFVLLNDDTLHFVEEPIYCKRYVAIIYGHIQKEAGMGQGWISILNTTKCNSNLNFAEETAYILRTHRLIPSDKRLGCWPIRIGESRRIIIGKCIMEMAKDYMRGGVWELPGACRSSCGREVAVRAIRSSAERKIKQRSF